MRFKWSCVGAVAGPGSRNRSSKLHPLNCCKFICSWSLLRYCCRIALQSGANSALTTAFALDFSARCYCQYQVLFKSSLFRVTQFGVRRCESEDVGLFDSGLRLKVEISADNPMPIRSPLSAWGYFFVLDPLGTKARTWRVRKWPRRNPFYLRCKLKALHGYRSSARLPDWLGVVFEWFDVANDASFRPNRRAQIEFPSMDYTLDTPDTAPFCCRCLVPDDGVFVFPKSQDAILCNSVCCLFT